MTITSDNITTRKKSMKPARQLSLKPRSRHSARAIAKSSTKNPNPRKNKGSGMIPRDSQMQKDKHILDNRLNTVVNNLRAHLPAAETFRLVSAYFTIYGYEALQSELHGIKDVRFLFGDPASVGEVDPSEKTEKSFDLIKGQLSPNHALQQKYLAQQCAKWVRSKRSQNSLCRQIQFFARQNVPHRIRKWRRSSSRQFQRRRRSTPRLLTCAIKSI